MGCSNGTCVPAAVYTWSSCAGGGPPIILGSGAPDDGAECAGNLAQTTFTWGVCSCHDIDTSSGFYIDGFNSQAGGYNPAKPQMGGGAGANGKDSNTGNTNIWGTGGGVGPGYACE